MSGYLLSNGTDLINYFEPLQTKSGNINSSSAGIKITGTTGPILFQNNNSTNTINLQTSNVSGGIQFLANQNTILAVGATGIMINSPARPSMLVDLSGATCYTNFNYGYNYISPAVSSTYTLTDSSPRYLIIGNTNSFTLVFPASPPDGTTFHIIKTSTNGTITLNPLNTFFNGDNSTTYLSSVTRPFKAIYYSGKWYCCNF
jgi:hypothetical protein